MPPVKRANLQASSEESTGLSLGGIGIVSKSTVDASNASIEEIQVLKQEIQDILGVPDVPQPSRYPEQLSEIDITLLSNPDLTKLYTHYVAYANFVGGRLATLRCAEKLSKKNLKRALAEIRANLAAQGIKGADATAQAQLNPVYARCENDFTKSMMMALIVASIHRNYSEQAKAISRTIELRKLEFEQTMRQGNIAKPSLRRMPSSFQRTGGD